MKKLGLFLIVILLIFPSISFSVAENENHTYYVDDDNVDGPWDGSIEHPFRTIQDGIDASDEGDTVFVFNGYYGYTDIVDKIGIKLIGEDKDQTRIIEHGDPYVGFYISNSKNFVISNFTISDCSMQGIFINEGGSIVLSYNVICGNYIGLLISESNNNLIHHNSITNNTKNGILISNSKRNKIEYNEISNTSGNGIITFEIWSALITHNNFTNNRCGINIYEEKFTPLFMFQNNIINNNFKDNNVHAGIHASASFFHTRFIHNYWGKPKILPKIIFSVDRWGNLDYIPCNIDWFPALHPN